MVTGPTPAIRQAARVEVMRLDNWRDLVTAEDWLLDHDVPGKVSRGELTIHAPGGTVMVARLGQWLTYDPSSGEFAVYDDDKYREQHAVVEVGLQ